MCNLCTILFQAERWLASKEVFLNNEDLGDSLSAVEALLQKQEAFEKTVAVQAVRIDELEKFAEQLGPATGVAARMDLVKQRRNKLLDSTADRRAKLNDTRKMLSFLRSVYEVGSQKYY